MSDISKATATTRRIAHKEAREIAQRLINSHFRQEPCARIGIPARPDYDDDLLIIAYIDQMERAHNAMVAAIRAVLDDGMLGAHSAHWDRTGGSGTGCPACAANRRVREMCRDVLHESCTGTDRPPP